MCSGVCSPAGVQQGERIRVAASQRAAGGDAPPRAAHGRVSGDGAQNAKEMPSQNRGGCGAEFGGEKMRSGVFTVPIPAPRRLLGAAAINHFVNIFWFIT